MCDWPCFLSTVVFSSYINAAFKMRDQLEEDYSNYNMLFPPLYAKNELK